MRSVTAEDWLLKQNQSCIFLVEVVEIVIVIVAVMVVGGGSSCWENTSRNHVTRIDWWK